MRKQQLVACRRRTQEVVDRLHVDGVPAVREALGLDAASADTAAAGTSQLLYQQGSLLHMSA